MLQAIRLSLAVAAGIYDDKATTADLSKLTGAE
jgi:hypothetical protein